MSVNKVVSDLRDPGPLKKDNETSLFFSLTVSSRGGGEQQQQQRFTQPEAEIKK